MLVDDMRGEHERLLQPRRVQHLQHQVVSMAVQLIGVVHLGKLQGVTALLRQLLQSLGEGTLPALRESYNGNFKQFIINN